MSASAILISLAAYSILLFAISWYTSRKANNDSYFIGNKQSPWFVVAYGMIGASLSGVTFMSVPGNVFLTNFWYLQVVMGYFVGYIIIATVLLPLYYRLNLTSIYTYLEERFGMVSHKTGSMLFIISRIVGASGRMYIVIYILHTFVFQQWNIPFFVSTLIFIVLILLYTFEGGVKTIIWTDTLQTTFMLLALVFGVVVIAQHLNFSFTELFSGVFNSQYSEIIQTDYKSKHFFWKNFLGGAAITVAMTGLDQEMMQKNLSCKNIKDAQKNMFTFSTIMFIANMLFLIMGAILCFYAVQKGITIDPKKTDELFPLVSLNYLGAIPALIFVIGLISAAYPSADGALTSLTTAFCYDFLGIQKNESMTAERKKTIRYMVHVSFAIIMLLVIMLFYAINNQAVISAILTLAGYTYGPLLGIFMFGILTKKQIKEKYLPIIVLLSPFICYVLSSSAPILLNGYTFGFELLIINGLITFAGMLIISHPTETK